MSPTTKLEGMVEVRLRYRPVGDVLTVTVRSGAPPGPTYQTELDDDTSMEWMRLPDGTRQLTAIQLIGARSRSRTDDDGTIPELPVALREPALDLIDPGHRHRHHPSAHRRVNPLTVHTATTLVPSTSLEADTGPRP